MTWCSRFRLVFDVWCYYYYIIIYYILLYIHIIISIIIYYITISYLILYSSYHLSSSPLSNIPFLSSSHLSNLLIPFIQSIRVGSSISLFIFQTHPTIPIYLFQILNPPILFHNLFPPKQMISNPST